MAVDDDFSYVPGLDLMVLETPLLRVSRPVAACSRCRAAKIKCDGKLPSCTACERVGKHNECSSTNDQFARGKERSYVATLETRVEKLERRIREAQQRKSSVVSMAETVIPSDISQRPPNAPPPPSQLAPPSAGGKAAKRKEALDIDDLVSDFGYLSVSATARDFYGFSASMSYAQLILAACNKDPLPTGLINVSLPPRHTITSAIQHYFDNFFALYPLFQEASFFASLDAVYSTKGVIASPFDHFVVRMVLAISYAGKLEQRGDASYMAAIGHVAEALKYAEHVLRPGSIQSVQALLLLHEYAMIDPHHFDSWGLIGAASRSMVDIGLHQDPSKGTPISKGKLELRRRVFWCVYAFDRSTSLVQTRAFSFSDDSANVAMPSIKPPSSMPSMLKSSEAATELLKLRRLQSGWYTDLFQSGRVAWTEPYPILWRLCKMMKDWFDNLPPTLNQHIKSFFELNLLYSYVYILAPSPRVPLIHPFAAVLIFEYCITYAERIKQHVHNRIYTAPISFYDAMRAYMTGRQFIEVLKNNQDRLLSGAIPEVPQVPADSAPPPPLPKTPKSFETNISRSISTIKSITECLGLFGMRWGYMSWRDRFEKDAEDLLNTLNRRKWELQESSANMPGQQQRGPSFRHTDSQGSMGSLTSDSQLGNTPSPYGQSLYPPSGPLQPVLTPTYPPDFVMTSSAGYFPGHTTTAEAPASQFAHWSGLAGHPHGSASSQDMIPPAVDPWSA